MKNQNDQDNWIKWYVATQLGVSAIIISTIAITAALFYRGF